jgi:hypothetical protein
VAQACFILRRVCAFDDLARSRNQPAAKFHAKCSK